MLSNLTDSEKMELAKQLNQKKIGDIIEIDGFESIKVGIFLHRLARKHGFENCSEVRERLADYLPNYKYKKLKKLV